LISLLYPLNNNLVIKYAACEEACIEAGTPYTYGVNQKNRTLDGNDAINSGLTRYGWNCMVMGVH
jgi:hypothetical protein